MQRISESMIESCLQEEAAMSSPLQQVLAIPEVLGLLDAFAQLTGTRVCLFKSNHFEPTGEGKAISRFCQMIKSVPTGFEGCLQSDKQAMETVLSPAYAQPGAFYCYQCHMKLWECIVPVSREGEKPLGYLMLGQVAPEKFSEAEWFWIKEEVSSWSDGHKLDLAELYSARRELIYLNQERFRAACKFLSVLANFLVSAKLVQSILPDRVELIRQLIAEKGVCLTELSQKLQLSPAYISDFYKEATGETLSQYYQRQRFQKAQKLLLETELTIKEIALELGYSDQNYFSRCFKKKFHLSPGQYRAQNRKS